MRALKVLASLVAALVACLGFSIVASFATMALTEKRGAAFTSDVMMTALAVMATVDLLSLPAVFLLLGRWIGGVAWRLLLTALLALLLAAGWLFFAFSLVLILNR